MKIGMVGLALYRIGKFIIMYAKVFQVFLIIFLVFLIFPGIAMAQETENDLEINLLRYPESVVYDETTGSYFVSSQETGSIIEINSEGNKKIFASGYEIVIGITISNNILYAVCNNIIRGFAIHSSEMVFEHFVENAKKLNDIAVYKDSLLYVSDVVGNQIFAIEITDKTDSVLASKDIVGSNGLLLDEDKNRILIVSWEKNSDLQSIDLSSGKVETVFKLGLSFCDGLTRDELGNFYISEWETGSIHKFDPEFEKHEIIYTNELAPADIYYNMQKNKIAIPLVYGHKLDFLPLK